MEGISILLKQFNVSTFPGGQESRESAGSLLLHRGRHVETENHINMYK